MHAQKGEVLAVTYPKPNILSVGKNQVLIVIFEENLCASIYHNIWWKDCASTQMLMPFSKSLTKNFEVMQLPCTLFEITAYCQIVMSKDESMAQT